VTDPPVSCKTAAPFNPPVTTIKDCATANLTVQRTGG